MSESELKRALEQAITALEETSKLAYRAGAEMLEGNIEASKLTLIGLSQYSERIIDELREHTP